MLDAPPSSHHCRLICTEQSGGIATYTAALRAGIEAIELPRSVIHIQHEYGLYGGKIPPFYSFNRELGRLRRAHGSAPIVATAHTVIPPDYRLPVHGSFLERSARSFANTAGIRYLHDTWGRRTWGALDGVIVHSEIQRAWIEGVTPSRVWVIPHFVYDLPTTSQAHPELSKTTPGRSILMVFGYVTPEKGQHLALEALSKLPPSTELWIAGGVRREADRPYLQRCQDFVRSADLEDRVRWLGYIPPESVSSLYQRADLVIAPFVHTSGSGSLAQALAHRAPTLASALGLNVEINSRVPGTLALFRAGDAGDLAAQASLLLTNPSLKRALAQSADAYAREYSVTRTVERHASVYRAILA